MVLLSSGLGLISTLSVNPVSVNRLGECWLILRGGLPEVLAGAGRPLGKESFCTGKVLRVGSKMLGLVKLGTLVMNILLV